jgi:hypothetical protein
MLRRSAFRLLALLTAALACGGPLAGSPTATVANTATPTAAPTATPVPRTAQLSEIQNDVNARDTTDDEWQTASDGQEISEGGGVRTGGESRVRLDTSDGSIVRIAANSEFTLLTFSQQPAEPLTRLRLEAGKVWAFISEALGVGMFEIETPTGSATVRGSLMSVEQDAASGLMLITCLEGQCRLSNPAGVEVDLAAGEQSEIPAPGLAPSPASPMNRAQIEDWLANFPEAQAAAQRLLDLLPPATPTLPPPPSGFNVSDTGTASGPRLAFDSQGSLHVVWEDRSARPNGDYFHRQLNPDGQWSEAQNLTEGFEFLFGSLGLLPGLDGRMCAVWNGALKGTLGMYRRCQSDVAWSDPEIIVALGGINRDFAVALTPDGTLVEIHIAGAGDVMFGDLELTGEGLSTLPSLAIDARGDLHVAWVSLGRQTGDPFSVVHRHRYTVVEGGGQQLWLDPETLNTDENQPDALGLKLVADAQGGVHILWSGFDNGLYYRRWTLQGGWSEAVNVAPEAGGAFPDLAVAAEGRVRVAWARFDGVYYTSQGAEGAWSEPSRVVSTQPEAGQGAEQAHLAVDAQGVSHIVWVTNGDVYYVTLP